MWTCPASYKVRMRASPGDLWIAVGMPIAWHPPHRPPYMPDSGIRFLPRVLDGEALLRPRMKDAGDGNHASAICLMRSQVVSSFWLRRRNVRRHRSVT